MTVKGWCPGAYRPMLSGDGLIVRIRPRLGRLTRAQALSLCDAAQRYGNGIIDLTRRANLQLRGVLEDTHAPLLDALRARDLLDPTPQQEARRNIIVTPLWQDGDLTTRLHNAVLDALEHMPDLPAKMGISIDTRHSPVLQDASADFRFERSEAGGLILRADGAAHGQQIDETHAADALAQMANWFVATNGPASGRMAKHLTTTELPAQWHTSAPAAPEAPLRPGPAAEGVCYGAPFGAIQATRLRALLRDSKATALRTTPWRLFLLEDAQPCGAHGFVTQASDPLLNIHACPGAPACASASVDTRGLARKLAASHAGALHISGCAKGCAHGRAAATTLVGRAGLFDLVEHGRAWDEPRWRGLTAEDVKQRVS